MDVMNCVSQIIEGVKQSTELVLTALIGSFVGGRLGVTAAEKDEIAADRTAFDETAE